jgi:hypothetical protein
MTKDNAMNALAYWKSTNYMKTRLQLVLIALLVSPAFFSQLTNTSFENWTGFVIDGWSNNNISMLDLNPVTPSTDAHSGALAVRGEVIVNTILPQYVVVPLVQNLGGGTLTSNPNSVSVWYKFGPSVPSTTFVFSAIAADASGVMTGIAIGEFEENTAGYQQIGIELDYSFGSGNPAATLSVSFYMADSEGENGLGSWYLIDDVAVDGTVGIIDLQSALPGFTMSEAYPQPFSQECKVDIELATSLAVTAEVYDVIGNKVSTMINAKLSPGLHTLNWKAEESLASGIYVIQVSTDQGTLSKRVMLNR